MGTRKYHPAVVLTAFLLACSVSAADSFAAPEFTARWQRDEQIVPNFWGPLANATQGRVEPYLRDKRCGNIVPCDPSPASAQRLVQYFDKGRMELNGEVPGQGTVVTSGLLVREMITGALQTGETRTEQRAPAAVPVAGDMENTFPLYRDLASGPAVDTKTAKGQPVQLLLTPQGSGTTADSVNDPLATIATIDVQTGHGVPSAFDAFRTKVGLDVVGIALTEPFWADVRVAGQSHRVLVQAFERRVLTYTPSNPDAFKVEFGNVGIQYYAWRYGTGP